MAEASVFVSLMAMSKDEIRVKLKEMKTYFAERAKCFSWDFGMQSSFGCIEQMVGSLIVTGMYAVNTKTPFYVIPIASSLKIRK